MSEDHNRSIRTSTGTDADEGEVSEEDEPGGGFPPARPGSLRDQTDLIDEDGDDIRQYTGEPVETDDGWVLPQQQNLAGRDNIAGGGEWPDPDTPPAEPVDEPVRDRR